MSITLEHDALYILPNATNDTDYAVLRASQEADGWQLTEDHTLDPVSDQMRERAALPAEQWLRYRVGPEGELIAQGSAGAEGATGLTIASLNLVGRLRNGVLVQPNEGL